MNSEGEVVLERVIAEPQKEEAPAV
jgi:hypothetical protein